MLSLPPTHQAHLGICRWRESQSSLQGSLELSWGGFTRAVLRQCILWGWSDSGQEAIHPPVFISLHSNNQARILILCNCNPHFVFAEREKQLGWLTSETGAADRYLRSRWARVMNKRANVKKILRVEPGLLHAKPVKPCCFATGLRLGLQGCFGGRQRPG